MKVKSSLCRQYACIGANLNIFFFSKKCIFQGGFPASAPPHGPPVAPTEEAISTLVSMGFDRNLSTRALEQARYDITVATNLLLEAQSH